MPPASLSTFAVMNPGPTTAKKSRNRIFQRLEKFMRTFRRHKMKHNREHQSGMLNQRPIFVLVSERAGTQSRTRINAAHDSEQTKSVKIFNPNKNRERKLSPNGKPETARLTPSLELRSQ